MSEVPGPPPPPPEPTPAPARTGRLVGGVLLVLLGLGWLLEVLDVVDVAWDLLLPAALILIGVVLLVTARSAAGHTGLIVTGVVLTVLLVLGSALDVPLGGGVGERRETPASIAALRDEYRLGVGQLTLDLSALGTEDLAADERVRVRVGIGQLVVIVPEGLAIRVEGRAALGNVRLFEAEEGGFDVELTSGSDPGAEPELELVLSVGLGEAEVRRG